MQLVDIGLNLGHPRFDKDRSAVVARARAAGVVHALLTGTTVPASAAVLALADGAWSRATVGVHPHHADQVDDAALATLRDLAIDPRCAAIGECGLDFERDFSPRPAQERAFEAQCSLAADLGLPLFLHQRGAWDRFAAILAPWLPRLPGAVLHCFTEGPEVARAALDLGLHLGITGWVCDDRRAEALRAALPLVPLHRLLLETDAPYLPPRDLPQAPEGLTLARVKARNEPAVLPHVAATVARWSGHDLPALAAATTATARRLFGLPSPPWPTPSS